MVAAVYSNRLKRSMMLQADPTIIYPITKGKPLGRRILLSELHAVNDYNTYTMTGLPVGPIANPGRESIDAVLDPAQSNALVFRRRRRRRPCVRRHARAAQRQRAEMVCPAESARRDVI